VAEAERGKGLHLMAPLDRIMAHHQARAYAKRIAHRLAATAPDRYTLLSPGNRAGRIFIDYLRKGRGTTAIGACSPRARAGSPLWPRLAGAKSRTGYVWTPSP
jgi:bifunctional non-homologous end joining protein LigD